MRITGIVEHGNKVAGKLFQLPTANLKLYGCPLEPGVYAGRVEADHNLHDAVICFGVEEGKLEAHLFDYSGDLYGKRISLEVLERVADLIPWESESQMRTFVHKTAKMARNILKNRP